MSLFLSKVALALVSPLSMGLVLILIGGVLSKLKKARLATLSRILAVTLIWVCATPIVAERLSASLERVYPPVSIENTPEADAIVVLGGAVGTIEPPRLTVDLGGASDRVLHAARLYRAQKAPRVIVSGGRFPWLGTAPPESEAIGELLQEWGVPESAIVLETRSLNTYQNAIETKKIVEKLRLESVLLVTSALHMPRALATFRSNGINALPAPTDFETVDRHKHTLLDWLPDSAALQKTTRTIKEYLGITVYRWRGWLTT